jgi:NAD(P)H-nitrite reductase large subunit
MKYIIIGGGVAGVNAIEEIRKLDATGEITLLDAEAWPLYSRVLLPHYIKGKIAREKVFLKKEEWYAAQRIDWQPGISVTAIDANNKFVTTSEDRELPFDQLLIVTGGDVRLLETDLRGVSYFRSLTDADLMLDLLHEVKKRTPEEQRGVIYGGGYISLEYINIFKHFDIPATVVMRGSGFFSKILSPTSQQVLAAHAGSNGVDLRFHTEINDLLGEAQLSGVKLSDGSEISCAMLGVGIGLDMDLSWLREAGVEVGAGVKANEFLETNLPGVYTAGDCAEVFDAISERQYVIGNWMNAQMQGRTVGKTMAGERTKFELVSSYATNLFGTEIVMIGDVSRDHADEIVQLSIDDQNAIEIFNRDGRTVGAALIGDVKQRQVITNAIKSRQKYA